MLYAIPLRFQGYHQCRFPLSGLHHIAHSLARLPPREYPQVLVNNATHFRYPNSLQTKRKIRKDRVNHEMRWDEPASRRSHNIIHIP